MPLTFAKNPQAFVSEAMFCLDVVARNVLSHGVDVF